MDVIAILGLVAKGVSVIEMLIDAGRNAAPAIKVVKDAITGAQAGTITDDELLALEAQLDSQIAEFNEPI